MPCFRCLLRSRTAAGARLLEVLARRAWTILETALECRVCSHCRYNSACWLVGHCSPHFGGGRFYHGARKSLPRTLPPLCIAAGQCDFEDAWFSWLFLLDASLLPAPGAQLLAQGRRRRCPWSAH